MHVCGQLLNRGDRVVGIDNLNDYYDSAFKQGRLRQLISYDRFSFQACDLANAEQLENIFSDFEPRRVINLAAQVGFVTASKIPRLMCKLDSRTSSMCCRQHAVEHLVYASSSSVYGANAKIPFSTEIAPITPLASMRPRKKPMK